MLRRKSDSVSYSAKNSICYYKTEIKKLLTTHIKAHFGVNKNGFPACILCVRNFVGDYGIDAYDITFDTIAEYIREVFSPSYIDMFNNDIRSTIRIRYVTLLALEMILEDISDINLCVAADVSSSIAKRASEEIVSLVYSINNQLQTSNIHKNKFYSIVTGLILDGFKSEIMDSIEYKYFPLLVSKIIDLVQSSGYVGKKIPNRKENIYATRTVCSAMVLLDAFGSYPCVEITGSAVAEYLSRIMAFFNSKREHRDKSIATGRIFLILSKIVVTKALCK